MILREEHDDVTLLRLAHGKASALDLEFLEALEAACERERNAACRAIVIAGQGSIFSAGVDLHRIVDGGAEYVRKFLPALNRAFHALWTLPKPTVAAINGHAIAGGCVIACACDRRLLGSEKAQMGIPEMRVGVPFPPLALAVLASALSPTALRDLMVMGDNRGPDAALQLGLVDERTSPTELESAAIARARDLASISKETYALNKRVWLAPYLEHLAQVQSGLDAEVLTVWSSDRTLKAIAEFAARTIGKRN